MNKEIFIEKSKSRHGDKYDYSKVPNTFDTRDKVSIICNFCKNEFECSAYYHYQKYSYSCPECKRSNKFTETISEFIKIHNNKYSYPQSYKYFKNMKSLIPIECPEHGEFKQLVHNHKQGKGCFKCIDKSKDLQYFLEKSEIIHSDYYNYSKVNFKNMRSKVSIICPEHGEFKQNPSNHIQGKGCFRCNQSHGERIITNLLISNNVEYISEKKFENLVSDSDVNLRFDFYIPSKNIVIEYDGIQHFKENSFFGGKKSFEILKKHDNLKNEYCEKNNIRLIRIPYYLTIQEITEIIEHL